MPKDSSPADLVLLGKVPAGADRRTQILAGAAKTFLERGVGPTRVEDILEAAGVSRATYYRFFRNKEDATIALFERALVLLSRRLEDAFGGRASPAQRLGKALDAFLELQVVHGALMQDILVEGGKGDARVSDRRAWVIGHVAQVIRKEMLDDGAGSVDPLYPACLLLGAEGIVELLRREGPFGPDEALRVRRVMEPLLLRAFGEDVKSPRACIPRHGPPGPGAPDPDRPVHPAPGRDDGPPKPGRRSTKPARGTKGAQKPSRPR